MKLGFKVGFTTALGMLTAFFLYQIGSQLLMMFVLQPLFNWVVGQ